MRNVITVLTIAFLAISCNNASIYNQYKPVADAEWHKDSIINFKFSPTDTLTKNNLYLNLRNNSDYEFSNLFLIVGIDFPDKTSIIDTLQYEMANAEGKFLGTGFTDLKENKLEYKTNVVFPKTGEYNINVQQAMRKSGAINGLDFLSGITDVGLSIEKAQAND